MDRRPQPEVGPRLPANCSRPAPGGRGPECGSRGTRPRNCARAWPHSPWSGMRPGA